ncbi:MAG: hypothetical protein WBL65_04270 [Bryobacteraceae bacterium]
MPAVAGAVRTAALLSGFRLLRLGGSDPGPPLLGRGDDSCHTCFADPAFALGRFRRGWRRWFSRLFGNSPSFALRFGNRFSTSGTHLAPLVLRRLRRGGGFGGGARQHGPKFRNPGVDAGLLEFVAADGGGNDLGCEFLFWHVSLS